MKVLSKLDRVLQEEKFIKRVQQCFTYEEETGKVFWKEGVPKESFTTPQKFTHYLNNKSGQEAGRLCRTRGRLLTWLDGVDHYSHKIITVLKTGYLPSGSIYHIDGDTLNERWGNLACYGGGDCKDDVEELLEGVDEESQLEDGYEYDYDYDNENISEEYLGELLGGV